MNCRHNDGHKHIELHDVAALGLFVYGDEASLSMAFTKVLMLVVYLCVLNSDLPMQMMGDGFFNFADRESERSP